MDFDDDGIHEGADLFLDTYFMIKWAAVALTVQLLFQLKYLHSNVTEGVLSAYYQEVNRLLRTCSNADIITEMDSKTVCYIKGWSTFPLKFADLL